MSAVVPRFPSTRSLSRLSDTLPPKRDAVLIVHANTVPAGLVALQGFEAVPRRHHEDVSHETCPDARWDVPGSTLASDDAGTRQTSSRLRGQQFDHIRRNTGQLGLRESVACLN